MPDTAHFGFTGPELCKLEACDVVDLLRRKEVSSEELLDASFSRIGGVGPAINATTVTCAERAYGAARNLSDDTMLAGLPISQATASPFKCLTPQESLYRGRVAAQQHGQGTEKSIERNARRAFRLTVASYGIAQLYQVTLPALEMAAVGHIVRAKQDA